MIRVLIVDDHPMVRTGLGQLLNAAAGISVVGFCSDGDQVLTMAATVHPDVVLMDIQMPSISGLEATRQLLAREPTMRVLLISASSSRNTREAAIGSGAKGFVSKNGDSAALVDAVRTVAAGGSAWPGDARAVNC